MITVSDNAKKHIAEQLQSRGKGIGIRIAVKNSGCSGLSYALQYLDQLNSDDQSFDQKQFLLAVDKKSLHFVDGTHIDIEREGFNTGLKFVNPNVKGECGCGESFSV